MNIPTARRTSITTRMRAAERVPKTVPKREARGQELVLPSLHAIQQEIADHPARFKILAMGRRWGKTKMCAVLAIKEAVAGGRVWWIAPDYKRSMIGLRELVNLAGQVPGHHIIKADKEIYFPSGGWIQVRSAHNPQSLRGEGLTLVIIDECAFVKQETWFEAVRPALSDYEGKAVLISTPFGRTWFYRLWMDAFGGDDPEWMAWQLPTWTNPFIKATEIAKVKRHYPARAFRQEYGAEFLEDAGGIFENVRACAVASEQDFPNVNHEYAFGLDWGKENDYTVIAILDVTARLLVKIVRFNRIGWSFQSNRVRALAERFKPKVIVAEANSMGGPIIDALQRPYKRKGVVRDGLPVVPFTTSNQSKKLIIEALSLTYSRKAWKTVPHPVFIAEMEAFMEERLPGGLIRYSAPEGMHDDTVIAAALAHAVLMEAVPAEQTYAIDDYSRVAISPV